MKPYLKSTFHLGGWLTLFAILLASCGSYAASPGHSLSPQPQPKLTPASHPGGEIVMCSGGAMQFTGAFHIYRVYADGTGLIQLTNADARDRQPAWSPDRRQIAFTSDRDGKTQLYLMDADGSHVTELTHDDTIKDNLQYSPYLAWSPDGKWITFTALAGGKARIFVIRPDGTGLTALTDPSSNNAIFHWSPDGRRILFASDRTGNPDIYTMNADGSGAIRLTDSPSAEAPAGWNPDGQQILFSTNRDGNWEIYLMNADGSSPRNLTSNPAFDTAPAFSPDGKQIAFRSDRDGHWQLYVMQADGSGQRNISKSDAYDNWFWWSPDGKQIFVLSTLDQQNTQWRSAIVNVDGSGAKSFLYGSDINWRP